MTVSVLSLRNTDSGLQKLLNTKFDFWRGAPRSSRSLKVRNVVIRQKIEVTQRILKRLENVLKCYGGVVSMVNSKRSKRVMT
jgi:hypothetical protein